METDAETKKRFIESVAALAHGSPAALATRMKELGATEVTEDIVGLFHTRLIVDDAYVEAVKQLVYECVPAGYKVDVVGRDAPLVRAD